MSEDLRCRDIMSSPPVTAPPTMTAQEAAQIMVNRRIGSIIIVDGNGGLIGIVTKTDLVRGVVAKGLPPTQVKLGDIMTRDPYYVTADASVRYAAELMGDYGIGHLPVLDPETNKVVGVVSMRDILRLAPHFIELVYIYRRREEGEEL